MKLLLLTLVTLLWLSGCASMPEQIQLPPEQKLHSYGVVIQAPKQHVGEMVRWGGLIANVQNKADHTLIEITYYPISSSGRPRVDAKHSAGRFRAKLKGLADPMVYKQGTAITVMGRLGEPQDSLIGEYRYLFPLVLTQGHLLWEELPDYEEELYYRHWPYHPYWALPWYHHPHPVKPKKRVKPVKPIKE